MTDDSGVRKHVGYDPGAVARRLTPEQQARLSHLAMDIRIDKITTAFLIEERSSNGKRSAFYSVSALRASGEGGDTPPYTEDEAKVAACLLSKHVVGMVYGDAVRRLVLPPSIAREELSAILKAYDDRLVALLGGSVTQTESDNG